MEEEIQRISKVLETLLSEDLSLLSRDTLDRRMELLQAEIERCAKMLDSKKGSYGEAEDLFKN